MPRSPLHRARRRAFRGEGILGEPAGGRRDGGRIIASEVAITRVAAQPVASVPARTGLAAIGDPFAWGFATLMHSMGGAGTQVVGAPFVMYHDPIDQQTDGTLEICAGVPPGEHDFVAGKVVPGGAVASTDHRGPYPEIPRANETVMGWIGDHGHRISGAPREIDLNDPQTVAAEDLLTEVRILIEDAAG